ncbi:hypothetical protein Ga0074812_12160 [Parafrankia irregularis]|uniref:Uncharacterized protein n=1 Tax=Parafrankia irregularis TaxID=795642 RepID=A0A0S4QV03_9ACTN|nr:hypothetical protein Ga0074812_12160 [Parafrankia irregularis]
MPVLTLPTLRTPTTATGLGALAVSRSGPWPNRLTIVQDSACAKPTGQLTPVPPRPQ